MHFSKSSGRSMGVRKNFFRVLQRRHVAYPIQVADNVMQTVVHKTLYLIYTAKKNLHESACSIRILFEIVFRWRCVQVCQKGVLSVIFYSFCWIGVSSNIVMVVNCRQLSVNWTWTIHNVCGALTSLCGLHLPSQYLICNVFYTLAVTNAVSFH